MSAESTSNTTKVYPQALEKHFFLFPPVLWWPPLSHFQEKGIFSWPFFGFRIHFNIPIASLTLEKSALPWPATLAALLMTISNRKLGALGAAGVPVAWWG